MALPPAGAELRAVEHVVRRKRRRTDMAKKGKRQKTEHEQTGKKRAPNLGQDEAQQQQRSDDALTQMGERTDQHEEGKHQSK